MKVFKFGGASLKNADAVKNAASIIREFGGEKLLVVVSAMGKTTNALEQILRSYRENGNARKEIDSLIQYHIDVAAGLFNPLLPIKATIESFGGEIEKKLRLDGDDDRVYDQVVSLGEIISSQIVAAFLNSIKLKCEWLDARDYIKTDSTFREGRIDWEETGKKISALRSFQGIVVTQGFIGSDEIHTTTLGREGSDFSAAIFGFCLDADSVTIWKDVPGVMSADPKRLKDAITFEELPFKEAAEMTYYGASVIHPKTIKPLANKGIPLFVKSFDNPKLDGTRIHECKINKIQPLIVFKDSQCLISCHVTDYTFVNEQQIETIFNALSSRGLKINMMQNSAISFSFCLDFDEKKVLPLIDQLSQEFDVYYNTGLTLITIKNFNEGLFEQYRKMQGIVLEQSSRSTLQVLVKS